MEYLLSLAARLVIILTAGASFALPAITDGGAESTTEQQSVTATDPTTDQSGQSSQQAPEITWYPGPSGQSGQSGQTGPSGQGRPSGGGQAGGGWQDWGSGTAGQGQTTTEAADVDTDGIVLIDTIIDYGTGAAAGTGLVIDSDGIVVTNHHVVEGSTEVTVTIPATGEEYQAEVLGYDSTADVAVLQLEGASGLETVTLDTDPVTTGATVTTVGNANGGGELVAAAGQITATGADITVSNEDGSGTSPLYDLIEVDAAMVAGDSGGALLDADGEVVGMNVAGSSDSRVSVGYAIPITTVLDVAEDVLAGEASDTVTLGRTAAFGITVTPSRNQVAIVAVVEGGPAATAGITAGSYLTAVDGQTVTTLDDVAAILADHAPGDSVQASWTDQTGTTHTATVTLGEAPLA